MKPTILHISHISNDLASGPFYSVPALVRALDALGVTIALYTTDKTAPFTQRQNYPVYYYRDYGRLPDISRLPEPFNRPDLVVFHDVYVMPQVFLAYRLRRQKIPYIMTPRGGLTVGAQNMKFLKKRIANYLFFTRMVQGAEALHCLTENEAKDAHLWGKSVFVIGNGIDLPPIDSIMPSTGSDPLRFVFIGRLDTHHKGLDLLLEASLLAQNTLRDANATIHLYGPEVRGSKSEITAFTEQHRLSDVVMLHEPCYDIEKDQVLRQAALFIHTSRFEGHPMAVLEALAYGVPCLLTPGTNIAEEVANAGAGWCTEPSAQAIAAALTEICNRRAELIDARINARKLAAERYSWERVAECNLEAYLKLDCLAAYAHRSLPHA